MARSDNFILITFAAIDASIVHCLPWIFTAYRLRTNIAAFTKAPTSGPHSRVRPMRINAVDRNTIWRSP